MSSQVSDLSSFLFARPSFVEGVARLLDFADTLDDYNYSPSPEAADFYAFANDWRAVGEDIRKAILIIAASK